MNRVRHSAIFNRSSLDILLIGAGGIGSMAALALSRMGWNSLTIYDGDVVSEENTGTQLYSTYDLGKKKVFGLKNTLYHLVDDVPLITRHVNFDAYIAKVMGEEGRAVLIVVEAQNLSVEALEEIRMISNLQTDKDSLLQVILVGQPGLRARPQHPAFTQLTQRIVVSYHLTALSQEETGDYIQHRLTKAGSENQTLFTPDAIAAVYRHSMGIPRTINLLCDAALVYGYADELRTIHTDLIEQVVQDRAEMGILPALTPHEDPGAGEDRSRERDGALMHSLQTLEERVARFHFYR